MQSLSRDESAPKGKHVVESILESIYQDCVYISRSGKHVTRTLPIIREYARFLSQAYRNIYCEQHFACVGLVARIMILFEYKCVVNCSEIVVRGKYVGRYLTEYSCEYSCVYLTEYSLVATLALPNMPKVKDNDHTSTKSLMSTIQAIIICHELYDCLNFQDLTGYQTLNICRKSNIWQCI